ncbi:MAG: UvrB/UvrC motif-containing protein [Planctomycetes bacterium]|nr:UvrB/UvrC motif-containing protein [Planctomycetota bacterium]
MFICEICKKRPATVHLTDIHNNEKKELHLCQDCAEKKGIAFHTNFSLPDMLAGLSKKKSAASDSSLDCPECGLSYNEFQARGRLGCPHDYQAFHEELMPMIERIHGKTQHVGKSIAANKASARQKEILNLQRKMRAAVEREAYEEAAELRDTINRMKQRLDDED